MHVYRMQCREQRSYDVLLQPGLLAGGPGTGLSAVLAGRRALVVVDEQVQRLHGARLRQHLAPHGDRVAYAVTSGAEHAKDVGAVLGVCAAAQAHDLGRRDLLVAVGGGVCTDVVSVAAALLRRGTPYACVPTTLLGQVDAGIGLKGGVNFGGAKNYLGSFHPPEVVLVDPGFLHTLPRAELRSGLAEVVKVAVVLGADLFADLRAHGPALLASGFRTPEDRVEQVLTRAAALLLEQLELDCYETGDLRRLLDFGHTFSPALEVLSGHALRHGEAVAVDMALSCALAVRLGLLAADARDVVLDTLRALGLPVHSPWCTPDHLLAAARSATAHRAGALNLVVPTAVGSATFVAGVGDLSEPLLRGAVEDLVAPGVPRQASGRPTSTTTRRSGSAPVFASS